MRVVLFEAPDEMLAERRRLGLDGRDEMWDEVLHVVPPPSDQHQGLSGSVYRILAPLGEARGLVPRMETGLFRTDQDYRVPDQHYRRPEHGSERGGEGAELVVEVRSPGDDTYRKLDFYAALGVREVLVLHPDDGRAELFRLIDGRLLPVSADPTGALWCTVLDVSLRTDAGVLRVSWADGSAEV